MGLLDSPLPGFDVLSLYFSLASIRLQSFLLDLLVSYFEKINVNSQKDIGWSSFKKLLGIESSFSSFKAAY
jgi:hypothetical protein